MIKPEDLLDVARDLAKLDAHRPRQASLRRAVSTAYYALFHLLNQSAVETCLGFGPSPAHRQIGETAVRWYTHTRMAAVCAQFAGTGVHTKSKLRRALPSPASTTPPSQALQDVAKAFGTLQQARHDADYDPSKRFTRQGVLAHVGEAEQAFKDWQGTNSDPFRPIFLLMMLTGDDVIRER